MSTRESLNAKNLGYFRQKRSHESEPAGKRIVPLVIIARKLEFVERRRIEGLPSDFNRSANENKFKVHKIMQEKQLTKPDPQTAWLLRNNSLSAKCEALDKTLIKQESLKRFLIKVC